MDRHMFHHPCYQLIGPMHDCKSEWETDRYLVKGRMLRVEERRDYKAHFNTIDLGAGVPMELWEVFRREC